MGTVGDKLYSQHVTFARTGKGSHNCGSPSFDKGQKMFLHTSFITCDRPVQYLSQTLDDYFLNWDVRPTVFFDGPSVPFEYQEACSVHVNKKAGGVSNWFTAVEHFLKTGDKWLLIMEDDIEWQPEGARQLRAFLRFLPDHHFGIVSPYCSMLNARELCYGTWHHASLSSNEGFYGALACALTRKTAKHIVACKKLFFDAAKGIHLDTAISVVVKGNVTVHNPTFVLHRGDVSTFGQIVEPVSRRLANAREPAL